MSHDKPCCEKFAEMAGHYEGMPVGLYPPEMRPDAQFEHDDDGTWNINGCCGGGCYVVTEMRLCANGFRHQLARNIIALIADMLRPHEIAGPLPPGGERIVNLAQIGVQASRWDLPGQLIEQMSGFVLNYSTADCV